MPPTSKFERRNYGGPKPNTTTRLPESIISEIEKESCAQHPDAGHSNLKKRPKNILTNRKQARKQARLEKKQRKNHHYQRQSHGDDQHHKQQVDPTDGDINASLKSFPERSAAKKRKRQDTQDARPIKRGSETTASNDNEEAKLARMAKKNPELYRRLRASNLVGSVQADGDNAAEDVEDMEMRRLEKKLGIKSSQNVTKKFGDDGLDFLLEGITM
ncbi:Nucleolar MIF4G domain-containing protein 1, partial [Spiromyces aspiralis]